MTRTGRFHGIDAEFRSGGALSHHDWVLLPWQMLEKDSGKLADAGMSLFRLSPDGRIASDFQLALGADSSVVSMAAAK